MLHYINYNRSKRIQTTPLDFESTSSSDDFYRLLPRSVNAAGKQIKRGVRANRHLMKEGPFYPGHSASLFPEEALKALKRHLQFEIPGRQA